MNYKKIEGMAYNLHIIKTDKFKKVLFKINFKNKVVKEDIVKRRILINILIESNQIYDTKRKLDIRTEELYNIMGGGDTILSGQSIITSFSSSFLNEKYTEPGMLKESIDFIFDLVFKPLVVNNQFDTKAFQYSKDKLRKEIESEKENPRGYAVNKALDEMGGNTPLGYHALGYLEDLENLTEKEEYEYYLNMLRSDNVDIFVIGNIDPIEVENIIKDKCEIRTIKKENYSHEIIHEKINNKFKTVKEEIDTNQSTLVLGFKLDNLTPFEKQYVLPIYNYILGGGPDSKLFRNVREKNSLCYSISSSVRLVSNVLLIYAGINASDYKKALSITKKQISEMNKGIFDESDIDKAKITYVSAYKEMQDSIGSILQNYIMHAYLNTDLAQEKEKNIKKVTKQMIMDIIPKIHPDVVYLLEGVNTDEKNTI